MFTRRCQSPNCLKKNVKKTFTPSLLFQAMMMNQMLPFLMMQAQQQQNAAPGAGGVDPAAPGAQAAPGEGYQDIRHCPHLGELTHWNKKFDLHTSYLASEFKF